jgi:hypothetical protein
MGIERKKVQTEQEVTTYSCDYCGKKIGENLLTPIACVLCGKYSCSEHGLFDPQDNYDYPDRYCKKCWKIGEPYRKQMEDARFEADEKIEKAQQDWERAVKSDNIQGYDPGEI